MKIFNFLSTFIFLIIILNPQKSHSHIIECSHEMNDWLYFDSIYICNVQNDLKILQPNEKVTAVIGHHNGTKTNDDVNGILISHKVVNFFPHGIAEIFKNLSVIQIQSSDLREIRKEDLQPFVKLKAIYFPSNSIHMIEKDTFAFNQNLEVIWLNLNKIKYIDPNVFDQLDKLVNLNLLGSVHDLGRGSNQLEVQRIITNVKEIYGFASILWSDNQELTTEVNRYRDGLIASIVINVLIVIIFIVYLSIKIAKKYRRSNRIASEFHDDSKISNLTELYEFQNRFRHANFNDL